MSEKPKYPVHEVHMPHTWLLEAVIASRLTEALNLLLSPELKTNMTSILMLSKRSGRLICNSEAKIFYYRYLVR